MTNECTDRRKFLKQSAIATASFSLMAALPRQLQAKSLAKSAGIQLYTVGKDHVIPFDFASGHFLGVVAQLVGLYGEAVLVVPYPRLVGGAP